MSGSAHYAEMLGDESLRQSMRNTVSSRSARVSLSFVLGFGVALLLAYDDLWGKSFFRSVLILPYVISASSSASRSA